MYQCVKIHRNKLSSSISKWIFLQIFWLTIILLLILRIIKYFTIYFNIKIISFKFKYFIPFFLIKLSFSIFYKRRRSGRVESPTLKLFNPDITIMTMHLYVISSEFYSNIFLVSSLLEICYQKKITKNLCLNTTFCKKPL